MKKIIYVVAEGESEVSYLNELNRFFREEDIEYVFYPVKANNGLYREVKKSYRKLRKEHRNERIEILVDRDIYIRENEGKEYLNREVDGLPFFLFSYMNFEDFLILHLDNSRVMRWNALCKEHFHDAIPLSSKDYMPLMRCCDIWPRTIHYRKGTVPFNISWYFINNLIKNDKDESILFHSDLTRVIKEIIYS